MISAVIEETMLPRLRQQIVTSFTWVRKEDLNLFLKERNIILQEIQYLQNLRKKVEDLVESHTQNNKKYSLLRIAFNYSSIVTEFSFSGVFILFSLL